MSVEYVGHMGDDLSVVNAARVSFDKVSESFSDRDRNLITYLAKHNHWSPFAHTSLQLRIKAPIFVARQLVKHQVGLVWNEVSRRYVDTEPEFYFPDTWRGRADNAKQGSSDQEITQITLLDVGTNVLWKSDISNVMSDQTFGALTIYNAAIEAGVAPEQARMVLPLNTMTEWVWTGNVMSFSRVCNLRLDPHAQKECRDVAEQLGAVVRQYFPHSWTALTNKDNN